MSCEPKAKLSKTQENIILLLASLQVAMTMDFLEINTRVSKPYVSLRHKSMTIKNLTIDNFKIINKLRKIIECNHLCFRIKRWNTTAFSKPIQRIVPVNGWTVGG